MPSASAYGSPMICGYLAAMPLARNAVTFSRCQVSRSSRSRIATLVSNRMTSTVRAPMPPGSCTFLTCARSPRSGPGGRRSPGSPRCCTPTSRARLPVPHPRHLDAAGGRHRDGRGSTSTATSTAPCAAWSRCCRRTCRTTAARSRRPGSASACVYLEQDALDAAPGRRGRRPPGLGRPVRCATELDRLHDALAHPGDAFEAESRLALVRDRLAAAPGPAPRSPPPDSPDSPVARRLRDLLDARVVDGITLDEAATRAGGHPDAPGAGVRRGVRHRAAPLPHRPAPRPGPPAAAGGHRRRGRRREVGFHDQAHLTRHFRRLLSTTPAAYARSAS